MSKKILAINYLRGLMIFWVIILHAIGHRVYGGDQSEVTTMISQTPQWVIALMVPFALLSLWGTAFSFLSGVSGGYSSASKMKAGHSLKKVIKGRMLTGVGLYVAYGIEKLFVRTLRFTINDKSRFTINFIDLLFSSTLESMAIWNFLLAIIFYFI